MMKPKQRELVDAWMDAIEDDAEDPGDVYVTTHREDNRGGKGRLYGDGYQAWIDYYSYPEKHGNVWQVACYSDGEVFTNPSRSEAMRLCEVHINNGHGVPVNVASVMHVTYDYDSEPPY
jgi:hypothetical protein